MQARASCSTWTSPTSTEAMRGDSTGRIARHGWPTRCARAGRRSWPRTAWRRPPGSPTRSSTSCTWTPATTSRASSPTSALGGRRSGWAASSRATTSWTASFRRATSSGSLRSKKCCQAWRVMCTSRMSRTATRRSSSSRRRGCQRLPPEKSPPRPWHADSTRRGAGISACGKAQGEAAVAPSRAHAATCALRIARSGPGTGRQRRRHRRAPRCGPLLAARRGRAARRTCAGQSWSWTSRLTLTFASSVATSRANSAASSLPCLGTRSCLSEWLG
mmetsp:Transcript_140938/g.450671  ORF Transcript_140938/g.450671 Transcript_140938/m.450671 type:complete len:275 (-) Transcript_140938:50-874(-)